MTNRALVLAALANDGHSTLHAPLDSRDAALMVRALQSLGTQITGTESDTWTVTPAPWTHDANIDCGLAGTVMRFVPPMAMLAEGRVHFDGDPHARKRPMAELLNGMRQLGAAIEDGGTGTLPFTVVGTGKVGGGTVGIDASASSQFVSALLLTASRFDDGLTINHTGEHLPGAAHINMSLAMLAEVGVSVHTSAHGGKVSWRVDPGPIQPRAYVIEPDLSSAAPFVAAAAATGGTVTVPGWPQRTTQAGDALRELLTALGANVTLYDTALVVTGSGSLHGIDVNLRSVGELTPVIAALCALADSPSRLRGIGHLRGHETDRLAALENELNNLGSDVTQTEDGLIINPRPLHGGTFATYDDHRLAQAGAVLGLVVDGVDVENIATTQKTLPDFPGMWRALLGEAG